MTGDLFTADESNTALSPKEQLDLIPSLSTRAELNEAERANIHAARVWAMRPRTLKRSDLYRLNRCSVPPSSAPPPGSGRLHFACFVYFVRNSLLNRPDLLLLSSRP